MDGGVRYTFKGMPITKTQRDTLMQVGLLGKSGFLQPREAQSIVAQTLLQKPSTFQQNLNNFLAGSRQRDEQIQRQPTLYTNERPGGSNPNTQSTPTAQRQQEQQEQGSFGFGTSKGQLFGEGGLVASLTQPFRQGIINPIAAIAQTIGSGKSLTAGISDQSAERHRLQDELQKELNAGRLTPVEYAKRLAALGKQYGVSTQMAELAPDIRQATPFAVTQEEHEDYMSNPVLGGFKSGVGIASFAVPVGRAATFPGLLGRGAIAGAGQGFGTSRPGEELSDTLAGATGGVISTAAGRLIGRGLRGIGKTGQRIEQSGLRVTPRGTPTGLEDAVNLQNKASNILRQEGIRNLDAKGVGTAYTRLTNKLNQVLNTSKSTGSSRDIISLAKNNALLEVPNTPLVQRNIAQLTKKVNALGKNPTAQGLANLKRELQSGMEPIYRKISKGNPLTEKEHVTKAFHDAIDTHLKTIEPNVAPLYESLSILHQVAPDAVNNFVKGPKLTVPFGAVQNVGLPISSITRPAVQRTGRILSGIGGLSDIGSPAVRDILGRVAPRLFGQMSVDISRRNAQVTPSETIGNVSQPFESNFSNTIVPPSVQNNIDTNTLNQILAEGVLSGEISASEANALSQLLGGNQQATPQLSAKDQDTVQKLSTAQRTLNSLENFLNEIGLESNASGARIIGNLRNIGAGLGFDEKVKAYGDIRESLSSQISRALGEIGTLSDYDRRAVLNSIPTVTDSAEEARLKLDFVREVLNNNLNAILNRYGHKTT